MLSFDYHNITIEKINYTNPQHINFFLTHIEVFNPYHKLPLQKFVYLFGKCKNTKYQ